MSHFAYRPAGSASSLSHRDPNRDRSNLLGESHVYGGAGINGTTTATSSSSTPVRRASPNPYSTNYSSEYASQRTAEDLESQNDDQLEGLSAKVKMLKDITVGIGNEVRDSTKLLTGMNDSFSETSGVLSGTFRRMNTMAKNQGGRFWWWLAFLVIVFWIFVFRWLHIL